LQLTALRARSLLFWGLRPARSRQLNANPFGVKERTVGADSFVGFFGIKIALDPDDEDTLDAIGADTDPRCMHAKRVGLETHSGRMTNGEDYFLYIGQRIGWLGLEHEAHVQVDMGQFTEIQRSVLAKLKEAGFSENPALHLQFVAQY
jgi:hypothetical protein